MNINPAHKLYAGLLYELGQPHKIVVEYSIVKEQENRFFRICLSVADL